MTQDVLSKNELKNREISIEDRIVNAAGTIAPVWPLENAISCNPFLHLEELNFWEAINTALERYEALAFKDQIRTEFVNRQLIKWAQCYFDEGIAKFKMPGSKNGFYKSWLGLASFDTELIQSKEDRLLLSLLPKSASKAVEFILHKVGVLKEDIDTFLKEQISQLPGWAGYMRWRAEWEQSSPLFSITEFIAVRLAIYWIAQHKKELDQTASFEKSSPKKRIDREEIESSEQVFAKNFVNQILIGLQSSKNTKKISAQWVFCIDARSESFRYHLEQTGNYETFGFAGFFGLPLEIVHQSQKGRSSCPVLIKPKWKAAEKGVEEGFFKNTFVWTNRFCKQIYHELKYHFGTPFALAESIGGCAGIWMAFKSLAPKLADRIGKSFFAFQETKLMQAIALKDQVDAAESALRMMGLLNFSPLVVFCGHGSCSKNNPFKSSLDCGACGGNRGGQNARLLASILNSQPVRFALHERGISIPEKTLFIGAEHDTTTDEIRIFDESFYGDALLQLKKDAEKAGIANRKKRSFNFGEKQETSEKDLIRRSVDWSEVRPEWGLAKNCAFLVGPRSLSDSLDLQGRSFLHSYDWEKDPKGSYLETILTAPMVVAQWINAQYFFSSLNPTLWGSGSKITQNIVGKIGVMQGNGSDLMHGLPLQSVFASDEKPYHEPLRLLTVVFAPLDMIRQVVDRQPVLQKLFYNEWVHLVGIDPKTNLAFKLDPEGEWRKLSE